MPGFREHESQLAQSCLCSGLFAEDCWLQALSVMGHRHRYLCLTESLTRSSQGKKS